MSTKAILGKSIKTWHKQRNLTQEELAAAIEVSVHAVSSIERGINTPALKTLEKISKVLNIPVSEFYKGIDGGRSNADDVSNKTKSVNSSSNLHKQSIINEILGELHKLDESELKIILKQVRAFEIEEF